MTIFKLVYYRTVFTVVTNTMNINFQASFTCEFPTEKLELLVWMPMVSSATEGIFVLS